MMPKNFFKGMSDDQILKLKIGRWKARTDLGWLCREIIGFKNVASNDYHSGNLVGGVEQGPLTPLHQPVIDLLQHFPKPNTKEFYESDKIINSQWVYRPLLPIEALSGGRRTLILDPRGHLKTTVNSEAHAIQWILNYPDLALLIFQASDRKAADILFEIKKIFQFNQSFRNLFPEHVPWKGIGDWGTMDRITTEARSFGNTRKEPTIMTGALEKGAAGYHFDVIKFSDIVDENNTVGNGLRMVKGKFDISENLLVGPNYWIDLEGTRYHFADTYGKVLEEELKTPKEQRQYKMHIRSVFKRKYTGELKTVEDFLTYMETDFVLDENGKRIPLWPERFSLKNLESMERKDPYIFSCQQLNWPSSQVEGATPFPVNNNFPKVISRKDFTQNVRIAYRDIVFDAAWTQNSRSNYSAIIVGAVDNYGRLYIEEIQHGRFLPDQLLDIIFNLVIKYYRHLRSIKTEKGAFISGLMPSIQRRVDTLFTPKGLHFPLELVTHSNKMSKEERILASVQPWYKNGDVRFLEDITKESWDWFLQEMKQFPNSETNDILDALADFLADKEWYGREIPKALAGVMRKDPVTGDLDYSQVNQIFKKVQDSAFDKWLKIEEDIPFGENVPSFVQDDFDKKVGWR